MTTPLRLSTAQRQALVRIRRTADAVSQPDSVLTRVPVVVDSRVRSAARFGAGGKVWTCRVSTLYALRDFGAVTVAAAGRGWIEVRLTPAGVRASTVDVQSGRGAGGVA